MPVTPKTPRARRGTAAGLLLTAAQELFAELGYAASTTRLIAQRAGVSEERIFRYYGSKAGLLEAAVITPLQASIAELHEKWALDESIDERSDEELVRWYVEGFYGLIESNHTIARALSLVLTEGSADPGFDRVRDSFAGLSMPLVTVFADQLERRGLRRGAVELQVPIMLVQTAAVASFLPALYRGSRLPPRDAVLQELAASFLHGLQTN
ncbi:MAG: HTH-type transcriptional repressor [Aeromicrobium sp.]|nr:HTH-type transcriptional repressor [Aeromicrobium sp.]